MRETLAMEWQRQREKEICIEEEQKAVRSRGYRREIGEYRI
tara:strand:- start:20 stop:142 length:123 start_codon:yes stop_codon:yes gene_type:complete